jgi:hypothetical protein
VNRCFQRAAARLGWDRNPLRRPVDRAESAMVTALIGTFIVAWLVLSVLIGLWTYGAGVRMEHAQQLQRHTVTATLTESAAEAASSGSQWGAAWVPARWDYPQGHLHKGMVATALNAQAGQKVLIWVNQSGQQTAEPLTSEGIQDQVVFSVLVLTTAMTVVLAATVGAVRMLSDRRRMAGWQRAWDQVGPTWSRQG